MDSIALEILRQELIRDAAVLAQAAATAAERLAQENPGHLEACGFELNRAYNVLEKSFERICVAFENHFQKRGNYHEELIGRMRLDLPGIRPAFLPAEAETAVRDLKGFRHIFRHAYDLTLFPERMEDVVTHAADIAHSFPAWCAHFTRSVETALAQSAP